MKLRNHESMNLRICEFANLQIYYSPVPKASRSVDVDGQVRARVDERVRVRACARACAREAIGE